MNRNGSSYRDTKHKQARKRTVDSLKQSKYAEMERMKPSESAREHFYRKGYGKISERREQ